MNIDIIRSKFIEYFKNNGHKYFDSSSLIPKNDPTLMFTNAGMNQFKNVFLGIEDRDSKTAVTVQKCLRAGGKHNDLDNVGFTSRHHTFFEMLGNFSFGAYFKKEAIKYAWDFLTSVLKIDEAKLYVTVYEDDDQAYDIWHKDMGIAENKIYRFGEKDNFWSMGDVGPCGPCSEIFYDHGQSSGCSSKDCTVGCECDRFVEIWNLVFMEFNRDETGNLTKLPKPSIDTGSGLERLTAVIEGVTSNYDIELFYKIKKEIEIGASIKLTNKKYEPYYNAVADHLRAIAFLLSEGCMPTNDGPGYVLRRIIRRAIRSGKLLGFNEPFLYKKVGIIIKLMGEYYSQLIKQEVQIVKILKSEEDKFYETLDKGLELLDSQISKVKNNIFDGKLAFKLHDTYGFPLDLTTLILKEKNISVDEEGFNKEMDEQKKRGKESAKLLSNSVSKIDLLLAGKNIHSTDFLGYTEYSSNSNLVSIIKDENFIDQASEGGDYIFIFDKTPFYAESGGQIADIGIICSSDGEAKVENVLKSPNGLFLHYVKVSKGTFKIDNTYSLNIDLNNRKLIARNHTSTHLLHYALRKFLGKHVKQAGSYVSNTFFRFDFFHYEKLTENQIKDIELVINNLIVNSDKVQVNTMAYVDATKDGTIALFDEKYGDIVRMIDIGGYSKELCGGTHVSNTNEIGIFKILSEQSTGAGVRRIEAVTSLNAYNVFAESFNTINRVVSTYKINQNEINDKIQSLIDENRNLKKELITYVNKENIKKLDVYLEDVKSKKIVFEKVEINLKNDLKNVSEYIKTKLKNGVIILYSDIDSLFYLAVVSKNILGKLKANEIIKHVSSSIGGRGGGKDDFAQGGGGNVLFLDNLETRSELVKYFMNKIGD